MAGQKTLTKHAQVLDWGDWASWGKWANWGDLQVVSCEANTHM